MLLSDVLSRWHYRERHSIGLVAPPERVMAAVRETTIAEMPVANLLFRLRGMRGASDASVLDRLPRSFRIVAEDAGREVVAGGIGQPWRPRGAGVVTDDFDGFVEPGYAKMAMNFLYDGQTLSTETRVLLTNDQARRAFRRYWLVVRPFSGLIRRVWLRAIARRASDSA